MEQPWGLLIIVYLFLGGLGAGAYVSAYLAEKGFFGGYPGLDRAGYYIASPAVAFGSLLLVFDLGQGMTKPWLILGMFTNMSSVMTWGIYILSAFIAVGMVKGWAAWRQKTLHPLLGQAGFVLALATGAYTGLLLAVVEAVPLWNSYLLPALFLVSALSTGLSATVLLAHYMVAGPTGGKLADKAHAYLIAVEILLVVLFFGIGLSGLNGAAGMAAAGSIVAGSFSALFWGVFVAMGLAAPLIVFVQSAFRDKAFSSGIGLISDCAVLAGGFVLRFLIIMAAVPAWPGFLG